MAESLRKLGLRPAAANFRTLRKLAAYYDVSMEHFEPKWSLRQAPKQAIPLEQVLVENSTYDRGKLKRRLYAEDLKQHRCELCGQGEEWRGRSMSLILDCPNCAATLETHCGRKTRITREPRSCLHCGRCFVSRRPTQRYCSRGCGVHRKGCRDPKPERRKVQRPSYEQLKADLASMSVVAVGRKYGVSDNAVRKWLRWYAYRESTGLASGEEGGGGEAHEDAA